MADATAIADEGILPLSKRKNIKLLLQHKQLFSIVYYALQYILKARIYNSCVFAQNFAVSYLFRLLNINTMR